jgi:IS5 family transposase
MRLRSTHQQYFDFTQKSRLKVVNEYREKYKLISHLLDDNPRLVSRVHQDLATLLSDSKQGRKSEYTSEQILRSLLVMFIERASYREVVIRIENSEFLQCFVGLGIQPMVDFSFLNKAFGILSERTWQALNRLLAQYAKEQEKISSEKLRMDTTVYETNIHYPTDSSLLWDSFRTVARLIRQIQRELPHLPLNHRFHDKKVKKLSLFIARNGSSNTKSKKRKVKSTYRKLIARVNWILDVAHHVLSVLEAAGYDAVLMAHYIPLVEKIIYQAQQRVL